MAQEIENKVKCSLRRVSRDIVAVTPEMASWWLSYNPHNRRISCEKVDLLCRKIKSGEWRPFPGIEVFDTGRLWNGQHRLTAIVQTGAVVPLRVTVYKKVLKETMDPHVEQD